MVAMRRRQDQVLWPSTVDTAKLWREVVAVLLVDLSVFSHGLEMGVAASIQ